MAESVNTKVKSVVSATPIKTKDGKDLMKTMFTAEDGKTYVTFARVAIGDPIEGTAEIDSYSGELRFKRTPKPFGGRGGGESNRQTALKAAAYNSVSNAPQTTSDIVSRAEALLKWLDNTSPTAPQPVTNPTQTSTEEVSIEDLNNLEL